MKCIKNLRRRGVAIEMAIVVMVLVMGLGTILVTSALVMNNSKNRASQTLTQQTELDVIGESFCDYVKNSSESQWNYVKQYYGQYYCEITDGLTLTVYQGESKIESLLTVSLEVNNGNYTVVRWDYY